MLFKKNSFLAAVFILLALFISAFFVSSNEKEKKIVSNSQTPAPLVSPSPSPTPKPLTFAEMNALYGPCVHLPTFMYHHVADQEIAKQGGYTSLTVYPDYFKEQMTYLLSKGYNFLSLRDLINFFDGNIPIPKNSVLLTFDDGYEDFYTNVFPILKEFNIKATMFLPTGLMENPGYLTWGQISEMSGSGLVYFGNHTWSHASVVGTKQKVITEIDTADKQLSERGLNDLKVFAYPYGTANQFAIDELQSESYLLAFTTRAGSTLCKKQRLDLPRIRIGNIQLSAYGF
jgi:peptidoglycan/xylan/chitin deacetylase (PgdA/CDA1 family)